MHSIEPLSIPNYRRTCMPRPTLLVAFKQESDAGPSEDSRGNRRPQGKHPINAVLIPTLVDSDCPEILQNGLNEEETRALERG